jgi:hypothetical protein
VNLKRVLVMAVTGLAMMSMTPVLAAPTEIENFCFDRLQYATLAYRRGAGEAFMANCIADLTPTPSPARKGPFTYGGSVMPRPKGKLR